MSSIQPFSPIFIHAVARFVFQIARDATNVASFNATTQRFFGREFPFEGFTASFPSPKSFFEFSKSQAAFEDFTQGFQARTGTTFAAFIERELFLKDADRASFVELVESAQANDDLFSSFRDFVFHFVFELRPGAAA